MVDVLHAVLAGNDGCVLCFGGASLGKTYTMLGSHTGPGELGVMPSTVAWLYRAIVEQKAKSGARFSVRVSAVAVDSAGALFTDLLAEYAQGERPFLLLYWAYHLGLLVDGQSCSLRYRKLFNYCLLFRWRGFPQCIAPRLNRRLPVLGGRAACALAGGRGPLPRRRDCCAGLSRPGAVQPTAGSGPGLGHAPLHIAHLPVCCR